MGEYERIFRLDNTFRSVYNKYRLLHYKSRIYCLCMAYHGGVKVSTGILRYDKRVELDNLLKGPTLKLNANNRTLALAA